MDSNNVKWFAVPAYSNLQLVGDQFFSNFLNQIMFNPALISAMDWANDMGETVDFSTVLTISRGCSVPDLDAGVK